MRPAAPYGKSTAQLSPWQAGGRRGPIQVAETESALLGGGSRRKSLGCLGTRLLFSGQTKDPVTSRLSDRQERKAKGFCLAKEMPWLWVKVF